MQAANKVALNTSILYLRMFITVTFTLLSTRYVLNALGAVDYGIFNLISGVIAFLSFLNAAMSISTQRYFSFHQGKGDFEMQENVFKNSLLLHFFLGFLIVGLLELAGLFLLNGFLNIPSERIEATKLIYHLMSGTVFFTVISVPFTGLLNAHENMLWVAAVTIVETFLKFGLALFLFSVVGDKLVFYSIFMSVIAVLSFLLYAAFCFKKYKECTLRNIQKYDPALIKELSSFAGWNLFGIVSWLGRTQGLAILLNLFLGTVVNAAYGISNQVSAQLNFFSATLLKALNPQIMKSEGAQDRARMLKLAMIASKFCFFLLAFIAIPCIFEMPTILKFWLKEVPEHTVIFCKLMLVGTLINQLTIGLQSAIQAIGKVKMYQIIVGSTLILNLPIAYFLLKMEYSLYSIIISYICIEFIACTLRLFLLIKTGGLSFGEYWNRVLQKEIIPVVASVACCFWITHSFESEFRVFATGIVSVVVFGISIYFTGLCTDEKKTIFEMIDKMLLKLLKKKRI